MIGLLAMALAGLYGRADEIPAVISKSADGRYEIRPVLGTTEGGPDEFRLAIVDGHTGRMIKLLPGEYDVAHGSDWTTRWHPRLPVVAVDVTEGRRFGHINIYIMDKGKAEQLEVPDYFMNALGRVRAVGNFNCRFARLGEWKEDTLKLHLEFNALNERTGKFQGSYESDVSLRLLSPGYSIELTGVTTPKAN